VKCKNDYNDGVLSRHVLDLVVAGRKLYLAVSRSRNHSDHVNNTPASKNPNRSYRFYSDITPSRIDLSISYKLMVIVIRDQALCLVM
jgi:hypothetical protein